MNEIPSRFSCDLVDDRVETLNVGVGILETPESLLAIMHYYQCFGIQYSAYHKKSFSMNCVNLVNLASLCICFSLKKIVLIFKTGNFYVLK